MENLTKKSKSYSKPRHSLFFRSCASALVILHLVTFGPLKEALAFFSDSASFQLKAGTAAVDGLSKVSQLDTFELTHEAIGETIIGSTNCDSYNLDSGFVPSLQSTPPSKKKNIPNQRWDMNKTKSNAFELDDYFLSPEGSTLTYSVEGNSKIKVKINSQTHMVSFSAPKDWHGAEEVNFYATDTDFNVTKSNKVILQVKDPNGSNQPIITKVSVQSGADKSSIIKEGDLITIKTKAKDVDGGKIKFSYSGYFTQTKSWKENGVWYSEAAWQTTTDDAGHYSVTVVAEDSTGLTDTQDILLNVGNSNRPSVINPASLSDIAANEGDLVILHPSATDADGDTFTFSYSKEFDSDGKWQTTFKDAGVYPIEVKAYDGFDYSQPVTINVTVNNVSHKPEVKLELNQYTVGIGEPVAITITAQDLDSIEGDTLTFTLTEDAKTIGSGTIKDIYTTTTYFSTLGYPNITVTLTDSYGNSVSDSKTVNVAEKKTGVNPLMGDFNGDSLTDLGLYDTDSGKVEIAVSKRGKFEAVTTWLSGFGGKKEWISLGGDFNGDGKSDIGIYNYLTGEIKIALSNGSGLTDNGTWLTVSGATASLQPLTGNFNGDKYTDLAIYNKDTGEIKVALGTGLGFGGFSTWLTADTGSDSIALTGDFNADGLTDACIFKKSSGEFKVAFSNTNQFVNYTSWISGFGTDKDILLADFNGDGLTDIGYWDKEDKWYYAISAGKSFKDQGVWLTTSLGDMSGYESATTADFNGDGITDIALYNKDGLGLGRWFYKVLDDRKPADLLSEIDNGIGGKTQVEYTYVTEDTNELPFPVYVADKISLVNTYPEEQTYNQEFTFYNGYFDNTEREFRGFARVRATDPITKNYSETEFWQGKAGEDGALKGQIKQVTAYDALGHTISLAENHYEVKTAGPASSCLGFPALTEQTTTVWEGDSSLEIKTNYTYDNIGNVLTQSISKVEKDVPALQKSTETTYAQAYEAGFNRPLSTVLKDKDSNIISKKFMEYDAQGNPTKESSWLDTTDSLISATYTYDLFGNVLTSTNALGNSVTTAYESTFYAYAEKVTNPLGQSVSYEYDYGFGVAVGTTDSNGATSSTSYDSLGRVIQAKDALNKVSVEYSYPDFRTKVTKQAGLTKTEYIDGLGRKYKTVSSGEDGDNPRDVSAETEFDNRGFVSKEYSPHYADAQTDAFTRNTYDNLGRVIKTENIYQNNEDNSLNTEASVKYIDVYTVESTDPKNHKKATIKDMFGNIVEVREGGYNGGTPTKYTYDIQNNLISVTDALGNKVSQLSYDSLGRKTKMIDLDMGTWTYEYDVLGNLIKQTDAKGQALEFTYDVLNRLIEKRGLPSSTEGDLSPKGTEERGLSPLVTVPDVLVSYLYDDSSKSNCIGRLSKVTDQSGSTEFFYDILGREVKSIKSLQGLSPNPSDGGAGVTVPNESFIVERTYDDSNRLETLTYPDGTVINYTYDINSGLLEKVEALPSSGGNSQGLSPQGTVPYVKDIIYSAKGQINNLLYGNGVSTTYSYKDDSHLNNLLTRNQSGTTLQDLTYTFDKNGNLQELFDNLKNYTRTYEYDNLDRLTQAKNIFNKKGTYDTFSYNYDLIGNMVDKSDVGHLSYGQGLTSSGTVPGPHAVTQAGTTSYTYDSNGNMVSSGSKTYEYDLENRLIKVTDSGKITSFAYDGDGGRVMKGLSSQGTVPEDWTIYIGSLFEKDSNNKTTKHIFAGANKVCDIEQSEGGLSPHPAVGGAGGTVPKTYYHHPDHLGSSNIVTDETGKEAAHTEFTPYGTIATQTGTYDPKYKFTGKELDNTGLYYYGARYYDPEIGRFITPDTIVQAPYDPQSLNRYAYCRNNPINYTDPTGHKWSWKKFWHAAVGVLVGVVATMVLGPGGALAWYGWTMAGVIGGALGGAITGGLDGGWQGALIGGVMGGALGGLGGWAYGGGHTLVMAGMFAAGAGVAGATDSWDSFAGGITGGLAGTAIGNGINSFSNEFTGSGQEGVNRNDLAAQTEQLKQSQQALDVKLDEQIRIGSRDAVLNANHQLIQRQNGNIVEMGGQGGKINVFQYNPKDFATSASRANLAATQRHTLSALDKGLVRWSDSTMVSSVKLNNLIKGYGDIWSGAVYAAGSNNSNFFVNTCVYGAGGQITGLGTWRPSYSTYRDDR